MRFGIKSVFGLSIISSSEIDFAASAIFMGELVKRNPMETQFNRRNALKTTALLLGAGLAGNLTAKAKPRFRLGACDWSIGPRLNSETFDIAKTIGLQGLQVSYNTKEDEAGLSVPATLQGNKDAAKRTGIVVSSLGIGELNRVPFKFGEERFEIVQM